MKRISFTLWIIPLLIPFAANAQYMKPTFIETSTGVIAVQINEVTGSIPLILLHGVYYDHHMWDEQIKGINDRTVITLDMPMHGASKQIRKTNWTLDDCAQMLIDVLDKLEIEEAYAVGHSWGSMTILRAAAKAPNRFKAVGLCNMPFEAATSKTRRQFSMQHTLLPFRSFYAKQVAKALYGKASLANNTELQTHLQRSMSKLSNKEVRQTDKAVIMQATSSDGLIKSLQVPAIALKGEEDYVPLSPDLQTQIVSGGHLSPLEVPEIVGKFIQQVLAQ
ncbi:MAG: alpha/beta hydrolase [Bacteroidota bacterium]